MKTTPMNKKDIITAIDGLFDQIKCDQDTFILRKINEN